MGGRLCARRWRAPRASLDRTARTRWLFRWMPEARLSLHRSHCRGQGLRCRYAQRRPRLPGQQRVHSARSSRPAHKPHIAGETVKVFYRFHPLCEQRARVLVHRSHRGEPVLMVADADGRRYLIPRWMTDPRAAEWTIREVPRLSRAALSELRGLVAMILHNPASPETGECHETTKTQAPAEEAAARATASDRSAEGREGGGRLGAGGPDRGGDAATGPDAPGRRRP